jgi:hypothetical protein
MDLEKGEKNCGSLEINAIDSIFKFPLLPKNPLDKNPLIDKQKMFNFFPY